MAFQDKWRRFRYWLSALRIWLSEARYVLTAVFVVLIASLVIWFLGGSEPSIRWIGMVLQLLGILTVILGIKQTQKFFGNPSMIASSLQWFQRFPPFGGRTIYAAAKFSGSSSLSARGYASAKADPNASIESRVEVLEKNIEFLYERISMNESETDSKLQTQKRELEAEKSTRESEDKEVLEKLEATEMGGIHISTMGTIWLFVGVILSSIPKELSTLFD